MNTIRKVNSNQVFIEKWDEIGERNRIRGCLFQVGLVKDVQAGLELWDKVEPIVRKNRFWYFDSSNPKKNIQFMVLTGIENNCF